MYNITLPPKNDADKDPISQIVMLFQQLNQTTDSLENKVDDLLHRQKQEFFNAYKLHLVEIRSTITALQQKTILQDRKLKQYQESGLSSSLKKKVIQLQKQLANLYKEMSEKDKCNLHSITIRPSNCISCQDLGISDLRRNVIALEKDCDRSNAQLRQLLKQKAQAIQAKLQQNEQDNSETWSKNKGTRLTHHDSGSCKTSPPLFPTQSPNLLSHHNKRTTKRFAPTVENSSKDKHDSSIMTISPVIEDIGKRLEDTGAFDRLRVQKELARLKDKNRHLLQMGYDRTITRMELEEFFFKCVDDVRRMVCSRAKISRLEECTFEEFKKSDKIELLTRFLQSEELLSIIYVHMFGKPTINISESPAKTINPTENALKMNQRRHSLMESRTIDLDEKRLPGITGELRKKQQQGRLQYFRRGNTLTMTRLPAEPL